MSTSLLPADDVDKLHCLIDGRVPERLADRLRIELAIRGKSGTICERRPATLGLGEWDAIPIARLTLRGDRLGSLRSMDSRSRWHDNDLAPGRPRRIDVLVREIDEDPTPVFWG